MIGKSLFNFPALEEGILLKRYKRFLADVELKSGAVVTAHCANTGPMTGVLHPGGRVRLKYVASPTRKLDWSWEQAEVPSKNGTTCWVGVNTSLPNKIVRLAIELGFLKKELGEIDLIKQEVPYGIEGRSRIDLFLVPSKNSLDSRKIYLEIKNTTWLKNDVALFPDTITKRGQKHLIELMDSLKDSRAILVPFISRKDAKSFAPGDSADPKYGELFRKSIAMGVEVIPCCFGFYIDKITWEGTRKIEID